VLKATLKSLLAHKSRLVLTAVAIVVGVGFMAGTFVLTDTIKNSIDGLFGQTTAGKAVVVRGVAPFSSSGAQHAGGFGNNNRPPVPESVLAAIKAVPGVAAADGTTTGMIELSRNGTALAAGRGGAAGLTWEPDRVLSDLQLASGRAPQRAGELAIDRHTATTKHLKPGDTVTVTGNLGPQPYTIVGVFTFGSSDTIAGETLAAFDTATAQAVLGRPGSFTEIDVAATSGTNDDRLATAVGAVLPQHYEAVSAATAAAEMAASVDSLINGLNDVLLVFAFIALFVGAFVIFNTFSILVGQRTRELALLRAVGANRGQVIASVLGEAAGLGIAGGAAGLGFGLGVAWLLSHLLKSAFTLASTGLQVEARTVIVSLTVGLAVTLVSSILPAVRASKVPPVAAMRDDLPVAEGSLRRRAVIGAVVSLAGVAFLALGLTGSKSLTRVGVGGLLVFVGVAILLPLIASPLARLLGLPVEATGVTGHLSRENAARNPRRTAATASALMIGVAVVTAIATVGSSILASFTTIFDSEFTANYVVSSTGEPFPALPAETALRGAPGVEALSGIESLSFHLKQAAKTVDGIDGNQGPQVLRIVMVGGSAASLAGGKLLVDQTTATDEHLRVGSPLAMTFAVSGEQTFTVGGIYEDNSILSDHYVLATSVLERNTNTLRDRLILVKTAATTPAAQRAISTAMSGFPSLKIQTGDQYKAAQESRIKGLINFIYVLLGLSIVVALLGIVTTMALSVLERTREIGLLRAVGMMRRQSRSMIIFESVIVSVFGAVTGLVLGLGIGIAVVKAVVATPGTPTQLAIPVSTIIVVLLVAAAFGLGAGLFPAQRAARLDVLQAISTA
jgi:putative ABC transport system permease protein